MLSPITCIFNPFDLFPLCAVCDEMPKMNHDFGWLTNEWLKCTISWQLC